MKKTLSPSDSTLPTSAFLTRLTVGFLLINLFVAVLAGWSLRQSRLQLEGRATVTTQNLTQVLEQFIGGSIHKIDVILLAAADEIEGRIARGGIDRVELDRFLTRQSERLPELDGLRMANARGEIAYGKGVSDHDLKSIADREYFTRLRDDAGSGLVISRPLVSRVIGKRVLILARRVNRPDGSFAGVVYGVVPVEHFLKVFNSIDAGRNGAITLRDRDLGIIARYSGQSRAGGNLDPKAVSDKLRQLAASGLDTATYKATTPVDRTERLYTYRRILEYPLYITVGLAVDDYLSGWRRDAAIMSSLFVLFFLITLTAWWRIRLDWKRRRTALQTLTRQEKKYRSLFEESKDAILVSDPTGRILDTNRAGMELFGYDKQELAVLDPTVLYRNPEDRRRLWEKLLEAGFVNDFEVEMTRKNGDPVTIDLSVTVIRDDAGNVSGHQGIARDMTERKRLERQLLQAQKMESIGMLAGGVAHDFNNLLTAISGYGQVLEENLNPNDDVSRESVEQLLKAADRAGDLTRSLLAFSRKQLLHPKPVQLETVVRNTGKLIRRIIGEDIEFSTSILEEGLTVMADVGQLEQVLMNLSTNSRDAMPQGGRLNITVRSAMVPVGSEAAYDLARPGKYAMISVSDTGTGIEEKYLAMIFEPFFTTKEVGKGTGLGLAMVYGAIKQHNGSILARSEPGRGTTFSIYLPAIEEGRCAAEERPAPVASATGGTETLLIAEDEEIVRTFMQKLFRCAGYRVIVASNGVDAVQQFREHREEIALVLSDVIMPGKNGLEILAEVRKIKPETKVLFISGYAASVMHEKGIPGEGMDFIQKPFLKEDMLRKVREILDRG